MWYKSQMETFRSLNNIMRTMIANYFVLKINIFTTNWFKSKLKQISQKLVLQILADTAVSAERLM